jgi:hypothetical protein
MPKNLPTKSKKILEQRKTWIFLDLVGKFLGIIRKTCEAPPQKVYQCSGTSQGHLGASLKKRLGESEEHAGKIRTYVQKLIVVEIF